MDGDIALSEAAEEVSFARSEGIEVTFPFAIGGEVCEMSVALDDIARRSLLVIVREGFGDRCCLVEETGQFGPLFISGDGDESVCCRNLITTDAQRVTCLRIEHIDVMIVEGVECTNELISSARIGNEILRRRSLDDISFGPRV